MAGKTAFYEKQVLNRSLRRKQTAVSGSNASTTNILVTAYTAGEWSAGDLVKLTTAGSYHLVTAAPDTTHVTVSPALGAAPTTGNIEAWGYSYAAVYIALFTAAPTDSTGGTEVTGGSYARVQVTQADGSWAVPSGTPSLTSNSGAITFPAPTANWGVVTHFGILDLVTLGSGNLLGWAALTVSKTINNGDAAPAFAIGALTISED